MDNLLKKEGSKGEEIFELMVHSAKGKKVCEEERKKFVISRAFKLYKFQDPISSKNNAANFLNCYSSMLIQSKYRCKTSHDIIINCLKYNKSNSSIFPEICIDQLEAFINC